MNIECDKMILAILQNDDYRDVVSDLNKNGFYATILNSSGGFLRKTSATIMIGLNHERLDDALDVLKRYGERTQMEYNTALPNSCSAYSIPVAPAVLHTKVGGIVIFVIDIEQFHKY